MQLRCFFSSTFYPKALPVGFLFDQKAIGDTLLLWTEINCRPLLSIRCLEVNLKQLPGGIHVVVWATLSKKVTSLESSKLDRHVRHTNSYNLSAIESCFLVINNGYSRKTLPDLNAKFTQSPRIYLESCQVDFFTLYEYALVLVIPMFVFFFGGLSCASFLGIDLKHPYCWAANTRIFASVFPGRGYPRSAGLWRVSVCSICQQNAHDIYNGYSTTAKCSANVNIRRTYGHHTNYEAVQTPGQPHILALRFYTFLDLWVSVRPGISWL